LPEVNHEGHEAMSLHDRIKQAEAQFIASRDAFSELQAEHRRQTNKNYLGKYFRYRQRSGPDGSWWMYLHVTGEDEDGMLVAITLQQDETGKIIIEERDAASEHTISKSEEITMNDYLLFADELISTVYALTRGLPLVRNRVGQ
jgi:hypothetical protein